MSCCLTCVCWNIQQIFLKTTHLYENGGACCLWFKSCSGMWNPSWDMILSASLNWMGCDWKLLWWLGVSSLHPGSSARGMTCKYCFRHQSSLSNSNLVRVEFMYGETSTARFRITVLTPLDPGFQQLSGVWWRVKPGRKWRTQASQNKNNNILKIVLVLFFKNCFWY